MTRKSLSRSAGGYALTALCLTLLIMTGLSCFAGPAASRTPDIYIAGFFRDGETEKPCYWVNGERKVLSLPVSVYDFGVRDIAAGEGIICVAGYYRIFPDDITGRTEYEQTCPLQYGPLKLKPSLPRTEKSTPRDGMNTATPIQPVTGWTGNTKHFPCPIPPPYPAPTPGTSPS